MSKTKTILIIVISLLVLIVVLQNIQTVETKLLFVRVAMPQAVLIFGTLLLGFVLGVLTASRIGRRRKDS